MERFSEEDFTILLLYYMNNNGVESINKDELCKKLLGYKANEKYKNLFEKIGLTRGLDEYVDLYRSISSLKYSGELWYTSIDRNTLYININEKKLDSHFENKNETDLILLQEIAKQFGIRNKAEKLANGCLNIYGINPNQWYRLVDGNNLNRITWQLITDGLLEENILNTADNHVSWNNPNKKNNCWLRLTEQTHRDVKINNSTFTMVQGLVDGRIKTVELNTEILDKSDLIELAGYSFNELPNSNQALTNEDPNVYSLKLKR